ncbi:hypothetical protein HYFRA_00007588, partial [Hymenoscyphus fraxineus]
MPMNVTNCLATRQLILGNGNRNRYDTFLKIVLLRQVRGGPKTRVYSSLSDCNWRGCEEGQGRRREGVVLGGLSVLAGGRDSLGELGNLGRLGNRGRATMTDLKKQYMSTKTPDRKERVEPRPSASILLLSPTNEILLLHRVQTSSSFPSAHVFPGGNLSAVQDGPIPDPSSEERHVDGLAYRMAAIRECFEESGILLARDKEGGMLDVGTEERERARRGVHGGELGFKGWVEGLGGCVDCDSLIPFTRWITPPNLPKRFTTQMYIYFLPLSSPSPSPSPSPTPTPTSPIPSSATIPVPTPDGGLEHTTAAFAPASHWLTLAGKNEIILFPPQYYLMHLLSPFLSPPSSPSSPLDTTNLQSQRNAILTFLHTDTSGGNNVKWADKVISPKGIMMTRDGKSVLGLGGSGPELEGKGRVGDGERVVVCRFEKGGPRDVGVRLRREVL